MTSPFRLEPLSGAHDRKSFACGVDALDRYFHTQVSQDIRRSVTTCYVAVDNAMPKVAGYYTLAAGGIALSDIPANLAKRLPHYPSVPVALMGRLAVDRTYRGRGIGSGFVGDALKRALRSEIAVFALIVDSKDEQAESFYRHHGFIAFGSSPRRLILPVKNIKAGSQ